MQGLTWFVSLLGSLSALTNQSLASSSACDASSFPINLSNKLCLGLTTIPAEQASTLEQCIAACCSSSTTCLVYQWRPNELPLPACGIGLPTDCNRNAQTGQPTTIGARQTPTCPASYNYEYPDGTKSDGTKTAVDVNACCSLCQNDPSCYCWDWIMYNQTCYLKSICNPVRTKSGTMSGLTRTPIMTDTLYFGQSLLEGSALYSPNQNYVAQLRQNGALAIYSAAQTRIIATPSNAGPHPYKLQLQSNNNIIISDTFDTTRWSSNTGGLGVGAGRLQLGNDGNLVGYDSYNQMFWTTGTPPNCAARTSCSSCTQLTGCSWCFGNGTMGSTGSCRSLWDSRCLQNAATTQSECSCSNINGPCSTCLQNSACQYCPGDLAACQSRTKKCAWGPTVTDTSQCAANPWCRGQPNCQTCTSLSSDLCQWCSTGCGYRSLNITNPADAVCYPQYTNSNPLLCVCATNNDCRFGNASLCQQPTGTCNKGACIYPLAPPGTPCGGVKYCNLNAVCEDPCIHVNCNNGNAQACQQQNGTCILGACSYSMLPSGTTCGKFNTGTCNVNLGCVCPSPYIGAACDVAAHCSDTLPYVGAPTCVPGAEDGSGRGYDIVLAQKRDPAMWFGTGSTVVAVPNPYPPNSPQQYSVPDGIHADLTAELSQYFTGTYKSTDSFSSQWAVKFGIKYLKGQWAGSGDFEYVNARIVNYKRMTATSQTDYFPFALNLQTSSAPLHPNFVNAVKALPSNYSFPAYKNFITQYGTHMIISAPVGGQIYSDMEISSCSIKDVNGMDLNAQAQSLFFNLTASIQPYQQASSSFTQSTRSTLRIFGGNTALVVKNETINSVEWFPTVFDNLVVIPYSLKLMNLSDVVAKIDILKSYQLTRAVSEYYAQFPTANTQTCSAPAKLITGHFYIVLLALLAQLLA